MKVRQADCQPLRKQLVGLGRPIAFEEVQKLRTQFPQGVIPGTTTANFLVYRAGYNSRYGVVVEKAEIRQLNDMAEDHPTVAEDRQSGKDTAKAAFPNVDHLLKKEVNNAIDIIDRVHLSYIDFTGFPVEGMSASSVRGQIQHDPRTGIPTKLLFDYSTEDLPVTIFHEYGHLIDLMAIGEPGKFESKNPNGAFRNLLDKAENSPEISSLQEAFKSGKLNGFVLPPRVMDRVRYLLGPQEIVARSYSQFVAEKNGSPALLNMIDQRKKNGTFDEQWDSDNFKRLSAEWENLLNSIGWKTRYR